MNIHDYPPPPSHILLQIQDTETQIGDVDEQRPSNYANMKTVYFSTSFCWSFAVSTKALQSPSGLIKHFSLLQG